jgi:hypothetical protein
VDLHGVGVELHRPLRRDVGNGGLVGPPDASAVQRVGDDGDAHLVAGTDVGRGLEPARAAGVVDLDDARERRTRSSPRVVLGNNRRVGIRGERGTTRVRHGHDHAVFGGIAAGGDEVALREYQYLDGRDRRIVDHRRGGRRRRRGLSQRLRQRRLTHDRGWHELRQQRRCRN